MSCVYSHLFFCHPYATCCPEYFKARHLIAASLSCRKLSNNSPAWKQAAGRQAVGLKFGMPHVATFCGRHDGWWRKIFRHHHRADLVVLSPRRFIACD
jgi:hypothetical protein